MATDSVAGRAALRGPLERWAALGGVLYVVLFIIGTVLLFSDAPDSDAPPDTIVAFYSDAGNRDQISFGWLIAGLGLFFFLWFVGALREAVRRIDGGGLYTAVTTIGGAVYAALAFAAIALNTAIRTMSDDTFENRVYPELIHAADDAGYVLHATGGAGAAAMILAATLAAMHTRRIAPWLGWLSLLCGFAALASIAFFPQLLLAAWIAVASVALFRSRPAETGGETWP
jgi:hypothetical protein